LKRIHEGVYVQIHLTQDLKEKSSEEKKKKRKSSWNMTGKKRRGRGRKIQLVSI